MASLASESGADATRIIHSPPAPAVSGAKVEIAFTVVGEERAIAADLFVRLSGETTFSRIPVEERKGVYRLSVPDRFLPAPGFEYYIYVRTEGGGELTSPSRGAAENPHVVPILSALAVARIVILTPGEGEVVSDSSTPALTVLFDPPLEEGDSAFLSLDGTVVTGDVERTPDYLVARPSPAPAKGPHEAAAVVLFASGERGERRWNFYYGEGPSDRGFPLSGRAEAGWALVENANVEGDAVPFYDETSSIAYDAYVTGEWGRRSFALSSSRDPIYDDEIRWLGRFTGETFTIEIGDVYPSLSEMTVSWLSGKGALTNFRRGPIENTLFVVRSLPPDTSGGIGTYSEFVSGERLSFARGRWDLALQAAYGWERESSVPESLRFLPPARNLVATGSAAFRFDDERRLLVESGWSDTRGDDTASAGAYRVAATVFDTPVRSLLIEYHDYRPGFFALASPTVDGGESGVLVDASIRVAGRFRQSIKAESYRDAESGVELEEGERTLQIYGRTDFDWALLTIDWNTYFLFRLYEIPYAAEAYRSRYGTLGLLARARGHTISLSGTRTDTRASSRTEGWSMNGTWSGSAGGGRFSWRVGERYAFSETTDDTTGTGNRVPVSRADRWSFTIEGGVRAAALEWRTSYERIDEDDPVEGERFTQHVFLLVTGRRF